MSNSTPHDPAADLTPEAQTPTPTPASSAEAVEIASGTALTGSADSEPDQAENAGEAETPAEADSPEDADPEEIPSNDELEEPSTEKDPGEEPKAPSRDEPEPDHEAVGIGVDEP